MTQTEPIKHERQSLTRRRAASRGTDGPSGAQVCDWIEKFCHVPQGRLIGRPVELAAFQKRFICAVYDNPHGTRRAFLSFGRKNGKTALAAFLLLNHLCGKSYRQNSQLFSTAQSRDQAALLFQLASKIVRMSPDLNKVIKVRDSAKELLCPEKGTRYRALSADASTNFGLEPVFIVHDELGQVRGPRSELYEALETSTGAQENPLSIIISTQAPTDSDLLSILIDDARAGHDKRTVIALHTAPMDEDPFARATIAKANPALGKFMNPREVMAMAEDARRMPARESEYRNLVLNQRVESSNPFVSPMLWKSCGTSPVDIKGTTPVYAGLDLSEVRDLTALVLIGRVNNVWQVKPTFWLPSEGLPDKARADRVPYDRWAKEGHLLTTPGSSVSYEYVATYLRDVFASYNIQKLAFDRWNMKHLKPWLFQAGFTEQQIEEKFVEFGQGTQSMSPALRDLEALILEREIAHGDHPVLAMCAANAVVEGKDSANRKLSKQRSSGRIDGMVALAMAVGVAPLQGRPIDISTMIV
jgi:phage terminase large subunit-like protein